MAGRAGPLAEVGNAVESGVTAATEKVRAVEEHYGREDEAVHGYVPFLAAYAAAGGLAAAVAWRTGRLPAPLSAFELGVLALATHKVSRIVAKDAVTSPVRAPFTHFEGSAGNAELKEDVVGTGVRKAAGELLTCPFCLAPWVAGSFMVGHAFAPRLTRAVTEVMSAVALSDVLQLGYGALRKAA